MRFMSFVVGLAFVSVLVTHSALAVESPTASPVMSAAPETWHHISNTLSALREKAQKKSDEGHDEAAIRLLQKGLSAIERKPTGIALDDLGQAYLLLATIAFRAGYDDDGQHALDELTRVRPDIAVATPAYPPLFVRLYRQARARWLEKGGDSLLVTADSPDVDVAINGRDLGHPPVAIAHLPPGQHLVALIDHSRPGASKEIVKRWDAAQGATLHFSFDARPSANPIVATVNAIDYFVSAPEGAANQPSAPATEPVRASAKETETPIAAEPAPSEPLRVAPVEPAPLAGNTPPAEVTRPLLVAPSNAGTLPLLPAQHTELPTSQRVVHKPVYEQWWFWTIIGAAAVGAGTAIGLATTARVGQVSVNAFWH